MQPHLIGSDQITERERVRSDKREGDQIRGRARAWPGAHATQAARLARPEVRRGLGGSDFFWVFSSSLFFFFFLLLSLISFLLVLLFCYI